MDGFFSFYKLNINSVCFKRAANIFLVPLDK